MSAGYEGAQPEIPKTLILAKGNTLGLHVGVEARSGKQSSLWYLKLVIRHAPPMHDLMIEIFFHEEK